MLKPAVIIPTRNRPSMVVDTVHSILGGTVTPEQVIVVDQSDSVNTDLIRLATADRAVVHIRSTTRGLSAARNEGLLATKNEAVLFLDDDMFVSPGWYEAMRRGLALGGGRTVVTGRVEPDPQQEPGYFVPALVTSTVPAKYHGRLDIDVLAGGNMGAFRNVFLEAGFFDERLGPGTPLRSAEDNDFGYRVLEAGYSIEYLPDAIIYHRAWRPDSQFRSMRWAYGCGKGGFYSKHMGQAKMHVSMRILNDLGRRALFFPGRLVYNRRRALGDLAYAAGMICGAWLWRTRQSRIHPSLRASVRAHTELVSAD